MNYSYPLTDSRQSSVSNSEVVLACQAESCFWLFLDHVEAVGVISWMHVLHICVKRYKTFVCRLSYPLVNYPNTIIVTAKEYSRVRTSVCLIIVQSFFVKSRYCRTR